MKMEDLTPTIKIAFCLTGHNFNLNNVTDKMGMTPTKARKKEDFPIQSIKAGVAKTYWSFEIKEENNQIIIPFNKLINTLRKKTKTINSLCNEFNLEADFIVTIYTKKDVVPIIELTKDIMSFANSINAKVSFDFYRNQ